MYSQLLHVQRSAETAHAGWHRQDVYEIEADAAHAGGMHAVELVIGDVMRHNRHAAGQTA